MKEVYIVAANRSPITGIGGGLSSLSAIDLGAYVLSHTLQKAGIHKELVQELFIGNVVASNMGQAPARQIGIKAGLSDSTICTLINKVCSSGMKAVMFGAQSIQLGISEMVVGGGVESMSNIPYYLEKARFGYRLGNGVLIDGIIKDALWDVYQDQHMGNIAESTAIKYDISRQEQDQYAINSYKRAANAWSNGLFENEIIPIEYATKTRNIFVDRDEEYLNVNFDKIPFLKPVFDSQGSITAANASTLNDGATMIVLASYAAVKQHHLKPLARIVSYSDFAQTPDLFTTSPSFAIPKAIKNAGLNKNDINFYEINEAFSVVSIVNNRLLDIDPNIVNVNGGAVSLGHPLGASGARVLCTLSNVLHQNNGKYGVASICNGGGGASAIVIEKL